MSKWVSANLPMPLLLISTMEWSLLFSAFENRPPSRLLIYSDLRKSVHFALSFVNEVLKYLAKDL